MLSKKVMPRLQHWGSRSYVQDKARNAINFGAFNSQGQAIGPVMVGGEVQTWWDPSVFWHALIHYKDGRYEIRKSPMTWRNHEKLRDSIDWMCGIGPIVLKAGKVKVHDPHRFPGTDLYNPRPRVAVGVTVKGEVWAAAGTATAMEMGQYLAARGCVDAILGDGGGSATWVEGGEVKLGGTRRVPNMLTWEEDSKMPLICIDPGHGGRDPGATGNGLQEKNVVLDISKHLLKELSAYKCNVIMTREGDDYVALPDRTDLANKAGSDYFLSIHCNGHNSPAKGYEDFIHPNASQESKRVRDVIHPYCAWMWDVNRGKKEANFHVLRETRMPAVLFEHGFITSVNDAIALAQTPFRQKVARNMCDGIVKALGLELRETEHTEACVSYQEHNELLQRVAQLEDMLARITDITKEV